jgi:diaminopimelate decarboxylase
MPLPCPVSPSELEELAEKHGTPFQLYDEGAMRANVRGLIRSFEGQFPGFRQFFAVKALPNPAVLRVLLEEGCGLDCSSSSELYIARQLGVPGDMVMYTSNYTSKHDLLVAARQGVVINLDDISLLDDLVEVCKENGVDFPERMSFRLNPGLGRTDSETVSNVLGGPTAKFGVPEVDIVEAYRRAKASGAKRFGMHMMTGSCVLSDEYWTETVGVLLSTVSRVSEEAGIDAGAWDFLNIGGGLGIPYREGEDVVDVPGLAKRLRRVVDKAAADSGLDSSKLPRLMMENGRYVTGPFGWLVARCHVEKRAFGQRYCGLDACMSNLMRPGMYGAYHHISVPAKEAAGTAAASAAATEPLNVVGTLCENNDWFAKGRELPASSGRGDLFVIHDSGAHSHSMGFQYNGKLRAPELMLRAAGEVPGKGGSALERVELVREREHICDLYTNTIMPGRLGPQPRFPLDNDATSSPLAMPRWAKTGMWLAFAAAGVAAVAGAAYAAGKRSSS